MSNPFENESGVYVILENGEGQHSLWPEFADVPGGWAVVYGPESRSSCLEYVESNWTDMRPKSLRREMGGN